MAEPTGDTHDLYAGVSSVGIEETTGRGWEQWIDTLDAAGGEALDHKGIVTLISDRYPEVPSAWWRQVLARGYSEAHGRRVVGETADVGFQVGIRRTLPLTVDATWLLLTEEPERWLGEGASIAFEPGAPYDIPPNDELPAITGEVRTATPGDRFRMTWFPESWDHPAVLQVALTATPAGKTSVTVHMEKLDGPDTRDAMRSHWRTVLDRLSESVSR